MLLYLCIWSLSRDWLIFLGKLARSAWAACFWMLLPLDSAKSWGLYAPLELYLGKSLVHFVLIFMTWSIFSILSSWRNVLFYFTLDLYVFFSFRASNVADIRSNVLSKICRYDKYLKQINSNILNVEKCHKNWWDHH